MSKATSHKKMLKTLFVITDFVILSVVKFVRYNQAVRYTLGGYDSFILIQFDGETQTKWRRRRLKVSRNEIWEAFHYFFFDKSTKIRLRTYVRRRVE